MATKQEVFGMDKAIQAKIAAAYDPERAAEAGAWIAHLSGMRVSGRSLQEDLKSGVALCKAVNKIQPGIVQFKDSKMAFMQRENIVKYCEACKKLGMRETDVFVTQDLYEGDNMTLVVNQIYALSALARNKFAGPHIGTAKFAAENKREFTKEQLQKAAQIVPMQNAGSLAVEKEKGTDKIVRYGLVGQDKGKCSNAISQQNAGGIRVEKDRKLDAIVRNAGRVAPAKPAPAAAGAKKPKFCPNCGNKFGADIPKFCAECGTQI